MEVTNNIYRCAICGKEYKTVEDRMNCEKKCLEKIKKDQEEALKSVKKEETENINQKILEVQNLIDSYVKKYNTYPKIKIFRENPGNETREYVRNPLVDAFGNPIWKLTDVFNKFIY